LSPRAFSAQATTWRFWLPAGYLRGVLAGAG
jgi:hypothetical protein